MSIVLICLFLIILLHSKSSGVAPWGCVHQREKLVDEDGRWPANYPVTSPIVKNESSLDPNHSHFILVDNGSTHQRGSEIEYRTNLEESIRGMARGSRGGWLVIFVIL